MSKAKPLWSVADAKARFSEFIARAQADGPQTITRTGRYVAVVVSVEDWARRSAPRESLGDFFANSPLRGSGIDLERDRAEPRDLDL